SLRIWPSPAACSSCLPSGRARIRWTREVGGLDQLPTLNSATEVRNHGGRPKAPPRFHRRCTNWLLSGNPSRILVRLLLAASGPRPDSTWLCGGYSVDTKHWVVSGDPLEGRNGSAVRDRKVASAAGGNLAPRLKDGCALNRRNLI